MGKKESGEERFHSKKEKVSLENWASSSSWSAARLGTHSQNLYWVMNAMKKPEGN
jgi:hypothetical protein